MKDFINKVIAWFKQSNRYKHLIGGVVIGLLSNTFYCSAYAGIGIASALEYKDKQSGNIWDWIDLICTVAGSLIGYGIHYLIFSLLGLNN